MVKEDLPNAERDAQARAAELQAAKDALAELEKALEEHKSRMRVASSLAEDAAALARLLREVDHLRSRADDQQRSIAHLGAASKTVEASAAEIAGAEARLADMEHKLNSLRTAQGRLQGEALTVSPVPPSAEV